MAELPAMPLWTDAYLGDTHHLSTVEHGAYLLLLIAGWRRGGWLPDDDATLAKIAGMKPGANWTRAWANIRPFFYSANGRLFQKRQLDELAQSRKRSKAGRKNAEARWNRDQPDLPLGDTSQSQSDDVSLLKSVDARSTAKPLKTNEQADATAVPLQCYQNQNQNQEDISPIIPLSDDEDDAEIFAVPKRGRKTALPGDWAPTLDNLGPETRAKVETWDDGEFETQCEMFTAHAKATDRRVVRWDQALTMWLTKHHGDRSTRRNGYARPSGHTVPNLGTGRPPPEGMRWDDDIGVYLPDPDYQQRLGGPTE